jgi:DNA-binding IclR family transcriptional regulator
MPAETSYLCEPQQRLMRLILVMGGHEIEGLTPGDIARLNECSASLVTRDLANLKHLGWAEQMPSGRWRLGPAPMQVAVRFNAAIERARRKLEETEQRYTRN